MKNIVFIDFACNRWDFFGSREFQDLVFVFDGMLWRYKRRMGLQFGYYVNKKNSSGKIDNHDENHFQVAKI